MTSTTIPIPKEGIQEESGEYTVAEGGHGGQQLDSDSDTTLANLMMLASVAQDLKGNVVEQDKPRPKSSEAPATKGDSDTGSSKPLAEAEDDPLTPRFAAVVSRDHNGNFLEPDGDESPETQGDTIPEEVVIASFGQDARSSTQTKLTNDEMVKWMNNEEHYLGPAPLAEPRRSFAVEDGDGGEAEADGSSAFQVTHSFGTTIDLAGSCKTSSSTETPPPPESLSEPITPIPAPAVAATTVAAPKTPQPAKAPQTAKTPQPVKHTNGTGGTPKSAAASNATKPASGAAVSKKPSVTSTTTTAPVKSSLSKTATSPVKGPVAAASPARATAVAGSPARPSSRRASAPQTPTTPGEDANKKVPMNKVKVGTVPSPNLKEVKSKIGSLTSATGSGARKPVVAGGDPAKPAVKIPEQKLAWKAESKVGSFNTGYVRKGGNVKIESKKVEVKEVTSKVGSFNNAAYKPGGGEKKIFDDKEYLKKTHSNSSSDHGGSAPHTPRPSSSATNGAAPPATAATGLGNAAEQKLIDA